MIVKAAVAALTVITALPASAADQNLPPGAIKHPGEKCATTIQPPEYQGCPQSTDQECDKSTSPRGVGECMAARRGYFDGPNTGNQWDCLDRLWGELESGWNPRAINRSSGAGGIPQALPADKMGDGWYGNTVQQVAWGLDQYIPGRYGDPCAALNAREAQGWY